MYLYPHLRYVFYVFGSLGILWFIAWSVLVYDGPDVHPRIAQEEREYLQVGLRKYLPVVIKYFASPPSLSARRRSRAASRGEAS